VSNSDVERIIERDFPQDQREEIRALVRKLEVREKARVVLACLKNSGGNLQKLTYYLGEASGYYREHIGEAEYPNYMKKIFRIDELSESEKSTIFEKDRAQYVAWLLREAK
jgi:hypothetical protein